MPKNPKAIVLPSSVSTISLEDNMHNNPISKTTTAIIVG